MVEQLTLPGIHIRDEATFANFFESSGQTGVLASLQQLSQGEGEPFVYLWGPPGSGKSHLLQAACHEVRQAKHSYMYLSLKKIARLSPDMMKDLTYLWLLCLDDVDELHSVAQRDAWEEALFHLYNGLQREGGRLLVAATVPPAEVPVNLPDLKSRWHTGLTIHVSALVDEEKKQALQQRAAQRGMELSQECVHYLLNHCSRSMVDLFDILDKLDTLSLQNHRKVTVPFIRECIT
ncbi:MAG: DnaA regulatory inactivator Hda [Gammaproteobacteria bacterium]